MDNRSQAAMEFLLTYGLAILAILIAIGALVYFGVSKPEKLLPEECIISTGSGLLCKEFASSSATDTITLRIKNLLADDVWVDSVTLGSPICAFSIPDTLISADNFYDFPLFCAAGLTPGERIKGTITITYDVGKNPGQGLLKTTKGELIEVVT